MPEQNGVSCPDEGQSLAIHHGAGPMLVLAGPGAGKTHVITHRIRYLISECHIPPNEILVITFTKAAALEMQARTNSLIKQSSYVQFGTFHSVFYQILKLSQPYRKLTLASDRERLLFVEAYLEETVSKDTKTDFAANDILKEISRRKNGGGQAEEKAEEKTEKKTEEKAEKKTEKKMEEKTIAGCLKEEEFLNLYEAYKDWLSENRKLDFDDMILKCYEYLKNNPEERRKWQKRFSYLLIDEFQDINRLQYETVKLLAGNKNLFAVGDDDQAIYSFRGSDPMLMKKFIEEFSSGLVKLSRNYRCSGEIVELAAKSIEKNKMRFPKEIHAVGEEKGNVVFKEFSTEEKMAAWVAEEVLQFAREHTEKTQAVLTRTNKEASLYEKLSGGCGENDLWKDIFAYLAFINCGRKRCDFLKIMNKPMRYISRGIVCESVVDFKMLKRRLKDKQWILKRLERLEEQTKFAAKLDIYGQLHYIWKSMGYEEHIRMSCGENISRLKECAQSFSFLLEESRKCRNLEELEHRMGVDTFTQDKNAGERREKSMIRKQKPDSHIKIMTYHGAKGLEFDRVYLPGLNYGRVPHGRMLTAEQLEEERRMFYVAVTRAKTELFLMYINPAKKSSGPDCPEESMSPFLKEIIQ